MNAPERASRIAGNASRRPGHARPQRPARKIRGRLRSSIVMTLVVAAITAVAACSAPGPAAHVATSYYLALGDSLSRGVQPDAAGASVATAQGYPDLVAAQLRRDHPGLKLVQLGCQKETTTSMIHGGICRYPGGSQLAAAAAFLRAHRGHVLLVTIDIGANDPESCASRPGLATIASCIGQVPAAGARLATILTSLRGAAPGVRIVGMSYYLPELAEWRNSGFGRVVAWTSEQLAVRYNELLSQAYARASVKVADVFGAFDTANFSDPVTVPGLGSLPRNVARICEWTWECAPAPRGPNQHANQAGYRVIASTVLQAAGRI